MHSGARGAKSALSRAASTPPRSTPRDAEWDVLLKDQHEGYITWDEFEHNQRLIADNATGMGRTIARGAVRQGEVLLGDSCAAVIAAASCRCITAASSAAITAMAPV